jgi:phage terminase small subunit
LMGELSNARHERFAQELAAGNPADAAYKAAGYQKHRGNAARLSANEHVKDRVKEIQAVGAERAAVTVRSLIEEAEQARIKAMESQNGAAAAVSAITAKAKLAGLCPTRCASAKDHALHGRARTGSSRHRAQHSRST